MCLRNVRAALPCPPTLVSPCPPETGAGASLEQRRSSAGAAQEQRRSNQPGDTESQTGCCDHSNIWRDNCRINDCFPQTNAVYNMLQRALRQLVEHTRKIDVMKENKK